MIWRIELKEKDGIFDAAGEGIQKDIIDLGIKSVNSVNVVQVFFLEGDCSQKQVETICQSLLVDSITHEYQIFSQSSLPKQKKDQTCKAVEVAYNVGVMDPVEESTLKGIRDLGIQSINYVRTGKKYYLHGNISEKELDVITNKVLMNKLIQHAVDNDHVIPASLGLSGQEKQLDVHYASLLKASKKELIKLSQEGQLFLNIDEMLTIQKYFQKLKRDPTDLELETIAQTWSEHCNHKTFRGNIEYTYYEDGKKKVKTVKNLLKSTIAKVTFTLNKDWCVSVFHDNAGVIKFDKDSHVSFKVETHNHPSALEPFGGANTGVGGVIRDTLGTGLGAKPIANTDIFCFAPPDYPFDKLPAGTLHPKRVMKGVVSGVRDYGNKMGIPTVNGAILFDDHFVGNPLVYCGNVGILPKNMVTKKPLKGDYVVAVGGKTGRDGIHGATFSSGELTSESEDVSSGAVQIGDPIQEKKVLDCLIQARDERLYTAITDCGAGGFSSAVGEMGQVLGARVDLDKAPLKYQGLKYMEIWISESQERMVMSVPRDKIKRFLEVFSNENVTANVIGEFTGTGRLELFYHDVKVCDIDMDFLHDGVPKITKKAIWKQPKHKELTSACSKDLTDKLMDVLSHYNVCSKEWVIRQYDHEVQGASIIKPLVGVNCDGPSDASVLRPKLDSNKGVVLSNGVNVRYGKIDPFWMAASCIDEAVRQIVAVGGGLDRIAILDNFCWGNPDKPDRLGSLVRAAQGCYKIALKYGLPYISGKDSLYNEYAEGGKSIAIPGTILISAIGVMKDVRKSVSMDFKTPGNLIYAIGNTFDELGGSIYLDTYDLIGNVVPKVNTTTGLKTYHALTNASQKGLIASMHDCSEGGLGVALAEMAFSGGVGVTALLKKVPQKIDNKRNDTVLFSESNSRFVVEVKPENKKCFEALLKGVPHGVIGNVEESPEFVVYGVNDDICINGYIEQLKEAWQSPLRF